MVIAVLDVIVGLLFAFGGAQEAVVRGILGGEGNSLLVGAAGAMIGVLLAISGVAVGRGWHGARELALVAYVLTPVFCVLAALPPRYVGIPALLVGVGYPLSVIVYWRWGRRGMPRQA